MHEIICSHIQGLFTQLENVFWHIIFFLSDNFIYIITSIFDKLNNKIRNTNMADEIRSLILLALLYILYYVKHDLILGEKN